MRSATDSLAELGDEGVDVDAVRRRGRTGSIVVLVDSQGERSFLTDPGDARALDEPQQAWLDGVDVLHVPLYSFVGRPDRGDGVHADALGALAIDRGLDRPVVVGGDR